jgi:hypothetical protein
VTGPSFTEVYVDRETLAAHYLAFDLVLVGAPLREDGTFEAREGRAVPDEQAQPYAAIRAALVGAMDGRPHPNVRRIGVERDRPTVA